MRFIICGAGATGGVIGGYLALNGYPVLFIDANQACVDRINREGLLLKGLHGTHTLSVPAVEHPRAITFQEGDICLLAVKAYHTREAVAALRQAAPPSLPVFCAQNGVRNEEIVARYFPGQTHGVMVYFGSTCLQPGVVIHTSGARLALGTYPQGIAPVVTQVGEALNQTPLQASITASIMEVKWGKLLVNLNNATYGLVGLSSQEGLHSPELRHLLADVMEEGLQVLREAGIPYQGLPGDPSPETMIQRWREEAFSPPEIPSDPEMLHRPSLWQDLSLQRGITEAEYFNGEIVRLGKELGIPTPLNARLLALVQEMA
ncbi:MAG: 2-dehydropantoate 2-reductase, partial [Nitrospinota bacterium]